MDSRTIRKQRLGQSIIFPKHITAKKLAERAMYV